MKRPKILQNGAVKIVGIVVSISIAIIGMFGTAWEAHSEMLTSYNGLVTEVALLKAEVAVIRQEVKDDGEQTRGEIKNLNDKIDNLARTMHNISTAVAVHSALRRKQ